MLNHSSNNDNNISKLNQSHRFNVSRKDIYKNYTPVYKSKTKNEIYKK